MHPRRPPSPMQPLKLVDFKMKTCVREKNPCKICLQTVNKKTGLQCKGACQNWVHYDCLNYTAGRIKDIKDGTIQVACPCPDCKTDVPKEIRTNAPYNCTKDECPANVPPSCQNAGCPSYNANKLNQTSGLDRRSPLGFSTCEKQTCMKNSQPSSMSNLNEQSGDSRSAPGLPSVEVVEKMCDTVDRLTKEINSLMSKMKEAVMEQGGQGSRPRGAAGRNCVQTGSKELCPKPCYCPQNPGGGM